MAAATDTPLKNHSLKFAIRRTIVHRAFSQICRDRGIAQHAGSALRTDSLPADLPIHEDLVRNADPTGNGLGQLYESLHGLDFQTTNRGCVTAQNKPDLRKSGGVFYTPESIVRYIVRHTLGKQLENATTPDDASGLKVLDPACGAGAFLVGTYEYLLHWHLQLQSRNRQLPLRERARILRNNIFGVDLDEQAVEVARLSLLLKLLEGETDDSIAEFSIESVIADLEENIKCGNSLTSRITGVPPVPNLARPVPKKESRAHGRDARDTTLQLFDWATAFPSVFSAGGFDAVVGNPPYLNGVEGKTRIDQNVNTYLRTQFASARGAIDASILFQELGLRLARDGGLTSMIVPNKFLSAPFGAALRSLIAGSAEIRLLADFSTANVFPGVAIYPVVYVLQKTAQPRRQYSIAIQVHRGVDTHHSLSPVLGGERWGEGPNGNGRNSPDGPSPYPSPPSTGERGPEISASAMARMCDPSAATWSRFFSDNADLLDRIETKSLRLGDFYEVAASATAAEAYQIKKFLVDREPAGKHFRFVTSGAIDRYSHTHGQSPMRYLKSDYQSPYLPADAPCVSRNRLRQYSSEKLIFAGMTRRLEATWDDGQLAGSVPTVQVLASANSPYSLKFVLGIVNSTLVNWVFKQFFASLALAGGYLRIGTPQIRAIPLPKLNLDDPKDREVHDEMVDMVEQMLGLTRLRRSASRPFESERLDRESELLDQRIDQVASRLMA